MQTEVIFVQGVKANSFQKRIFKNYEHFILSSLPDCSFPNFRTLLKNNKQYVNHIDAHISFIIWPAPYPILVLKGTLSGLVMMNNSCNLVITKH